MRLRARTIPVDAVDASLESRLFALMRANYDGMKPDTFKTDLAEKHWVILLEDADSDIVQGFSTQRVYRVSHDRSDLNIVFSGDTIISPACWGSQKLPIAFGQLMLSIADREPAHPLYWFLICKGHRTYRYLPVFFKAFIPNADGAVPGRDETLLHKLARERFGPAYDRHRGIIHAHSRSPRLTSQLASVEPDRVTRDPHIAFFLEANPGYHRGDELACLARFSRSNLKPFILRRLEAHRRAQCDRQDPIPS